MRNWIKGLCFAVVSVVLVSCDKDDDSYSKERQVRNYAGEGTKTYTFDSLATPHPDSVFISNVRYVVEKDSAHFTWSTRSEEKFDESFAYNKQHRYSKTGFSDSMYYRVERDTLFFEYRYKSPVNNNSTTVLYKGVIY